jgi:hypothetical protein
MSNKYAFIFTLHLFLLYQSPDLYNTTFKFFAGRQSTIQKCFGNFTGTAIEFRIDPKAVMTSSATNSTLVTSSLGARRAYPPPMAIPSRCAYMNMLFDLVHLYAWNSGFSAKTNDSPVP